MVGGQPLSGGAVPNTGEIPHIRGGSMKAAILSGGLAVSLPILGVSGGVSSGGHAQIWAGTSGQGAGRLNSVMLHTQMQSGQSVVFYDASTIAVSGVSVSGQAILGVVPGPWTLGVLTGSGMLPVIWTGAPYNFDSPFLSGLCVAVPSGAPGFTCTFTPDSSPPIG